MKIYGATEAAAELDIDPRALRRFLRQDDSYRNAGMGGRYMFNESELVSLRKAYTSWQKSHPVKKRKVDEVDPRILDDDPGVPLEKLSARGLTPSLRASRAAARAQRQQRLRVRIATVLAPRYDDQPVEIEP